MNFQYELAVNIAFPVYPLHIHSFRLILVLLCILWLLMLPWQRIRVSCSCLDFFSALSLAPYFYPQLSLSIYEFYTFLNLSLCCFSTKFLTILQEPAPNPLHKDFPDLAAVRASFPTVLFQSFPENMLHQPYGLSRVFLEKLNLLQCLY